MTGGVVIYRLGSLGDTVVTLPCFHRIARSFPDEKRHVLTNAPVSASAAPINAILGGSGLIDDVIAYPVGTRSIGALWRLRRQLQSLDCETLVYLTEARGLAAAWRDVAFFRLCGFTRIIGAPVTPDRQFWRKEGGTGIEEHECERLARCIGELGPIDLADPAQWDLRLTESEKDAARLALGPLCEQPFLAIAMGTKWPENDWGEKNWLTFLSQVARSHPDRPLVILGAADDRPRAVRAAEIWPGPVADLCGVITPRESSSVLSRAALFIGHDSGPLHLASISRCQWVGLFSDRNPPGRWHPYLGGGKIFRAAGPMASLPVQDVAAYVSEALD